jgi:hypothetical protein
VALNVDTLYSSAWIDLRSGPTVLVVPAFEEERYVSVQLFDLYTYIVGYVTPRTHGRGGGRYLLVGPDWSGAAPDGIDEVFRAPTDLLLVFIRTQVLGPDDLESVHEVQDGFSVRSAGSNVRTPSMPPALRPVDVRAAPDLRFFDVLGWMLAFMPPLEEDQALRGQLDAVGVGRADGSSSLSDDETSQVLAGMGDGAQRLAARAKTVRSSAELFGSRSFFDGDHLSRSCGAMLGILGNAAEEYLGVGYAADEHGEPFDGASSAYEITFHPGDEPPVGGFWSITLYDAERFLYDHPLRRHVINDRTLATIEPGPEGGRTIHISHRSPDPELLAGWLPCPATPFTLAFRTYLPGEAIRNGTWTAPPVRRTDRRETR